MILKPLENFTGNGVLRGTIVALSDEKEPLGWELYGNYSSLSFRERAAQDLSANTGISIEKATAMLSQVLKVARSAVNTAPTVPDIQQASIRAKFPNLIDIVATPEGKPAFLFQENNSVILRQEWREDNKLYIPPSPEHMPYLLPRETEIKKALSDDDDLSLFNDLIGWHKRASKLGEDSHYELIALFDFHTYLAELFEYSPYLVLQTLDAERGKTRQGNSIAWVSYRGIVTETLQEANLFRWSDSMGCTIFFDVRDIISKAERRGADDILLGRFQRQGAKVARVLDPQAGPFKGVVYFEVYGPTIMGLNEPLKEPYLSRGIVLVPPEASGKYPNLSPQEALPFKERLDAFRARHFLRSLPSINKPVVGRLGDCLQPFNQIAAIIGGPVFDHFADIANLLAKERASDRAESKEARLIVAIEQVANETTNDNLPVQRIADIFNEGLSERSTLSEESVGRRLKGLGFKAGARANSGRTRLYDANLLKALREKFGLAINENNCYQEPSLPSQPSSAASTHDDDGSATDQSTDIPAMDNRQSTVTEDTEEKQIQNGLPVTEVTDMTDENGQRNKKPERACYACGENNWWQRSDGGWVCNICHPKPGV